MQHYGLSRYITENSIRNEVKEKASLKGKNLEEIEKQNENLKEENIKKDLLLRELEAIKAENVELNELIGMKKKYTNFESIPGQVINRNFSNFEKTVTINVGEDNGVSQDMAVVADKGLFGRVISTTKNTSKVQLITDPASKVSVNVGNQMDSMILKGDIESGLVLNRLPMQTKIVTNQDIFTSGIGGIFPKGIYIGTVNEIRYKSNETDSLATVKSVMDYEAVNKILVLKKGI